MGLIAKKEVGDISKLRKEIIKYTIIVAAVVGGASLLILWPNAYFSYGLALGTCASVINMNILSVFIEQASKKGKKGLIQGSFLVRVLIYGSVFWLVMNTAALASLGAVIGFFLPQIAMLYIFRLRPVIRRKTGEEPGYIYVIDTKSKVFFKEPRFVIDNYNSGKRSYVTHRRFRKVRKVCT